MDARAVPAARNGGYADGEQRIAALAGHAHASAYLLIALIAEADDAGAWAACGFTSCAEWLQRRCGLSASAAREKVRVARALCTLPGIAAAFGCGELSYTTVRVLTRIARPGTEARWLSHARRRTAAQLQALVREVRRRETDAGHAAESPAARHALR